MAACPGAFSGGFWFVPDHCYDEINLHRNWSRSSAGSALEWIEIALKGIELKIRPRNFQRGSYLFDIGFIIRYTYPIYV